MYYVLHSSFDYSIQFIKDVSFTEFDDCTPHGPYKNFSIAKEEALRMARCDRDFMNGNIRRLKDTTKKSIGDE